MSLHPPTYGNIVALSTLFTLEFVVMANNAKMSESEIDAMIDGKRITKARKYKAYLERNGYNAVTVAGFDDAMWKLIAKGAGMNPPGDSGETIRYILAFMSPPRQ